MARLLVRGFAWTLLAAVGACGGGDGSEAGAPVEDVALDAAEVAEDTSDSEEAASTPALALEAEALGLLTYLEDGPAPVVESEADGETTYRFEPGDGPLCMRGDPFRFAVRDTGSEDLVIFLQGGGACWSEFCLAVTKAPPGIPSVNALDPDMEANPLRGWNAVYLPYCDGSLFIGDRDHDDDGDGAPDRFHRGIHNLAGALRLARERFPAPRRVLLTGSSAGSYGTMVATLLVRSAWHDAELLVFQDSGVGVADPTDPSLIETLLDEFGARRFIPDTCEECLVNGHVTPLVAWSLERDPNLRVAAFSAYYDSIIGHVFLDLDPVLFRDTLLDETDRVHDAFPERYRRFLVDGVTHTALLGDVSGIIGTDLDAVELPSDASSLLSDLDIGTLDGTAVGDLTVGEWLAAFVAGDPAWEDILDEPGTPPDWN